MVGGPGASSQTILCRGSSFPPAGGGRSSPTPSARRHLFPIAAAPYGGGRGAPGMSPAAPCQFVEPATLPPGRMTGTQDKTRTMRPSGRSGGAGSPGVVLPRSIDAGQSSEARQLFDGPAVPPAAHDRHGGLPRARSVFARLSGGAGPRKLAASGHLDPSSARSLSLSPFQSNGRGLSQQPEGAASRHLGHEGGPRRLRPFVKSAPLPSSRQASGTGASDIAAIKAALGGGVTAWM